MTDEGRRREGLILSVDTCDDWRLMGNVAGLTLEPTLESRVRLGFFFLEPEADEEELLQTPATSEDAGT